MDGRVTPRWRFPRTGPVLGLALGACLLAGARPRADEGSRLQETSAPGLNTQVRIELNAEGLFRPSVGVDPSAAETKMPKPLALDVQTRLIFHERLLKSEGRPAGKVRAARWVVQAASAINGEIRPTASVLRPGLSLLVAERTAGEPSVVVASPAGPMTRGELELVQGPADPLLLAEFLPAGPVVVGTSWKLPDAAAFALSGYDAVKSTTVLATVERLADTSARIALKGDIEGAALGGAGTISCDGFLDFNRETNLVERLEVRRVEKRQAGPVEAGLDVKSTLTVARRPTRQAPELADAALAKAALETSPPSLLLQLVSPDGKYNLLHDRAWHTYWDDPKLVVLKRLEKGKVIAQCNLAAGPRVAPGKHQDPAQFREDIRRSLKDRFVEFLGAGEVEGDPAGGFRYKVGVRGREGELGVLWNYYLIASPEGEQLLATFTLAREDAAAFGTQDLEIVGSLQWSLPTPSASAR